MSIYRMIAMVAFVLFAPLLGGLLDGMDRKISARMQGRRGPSILQPFYDVIKLMQKKLLVVNSSQYFMIVSYLFFVIFTGTLFFGGFDLLLCFFSLTTAAMFFVLAAADATLSR